jgi:1-deoxy-D-xylulose-5-phosphate reductoisomerase
MQQRLVILGSTGSVGTQVLEVVSAHPDRFKIAALAAYHNDKLLETQIERFKPALAVLVDHKAAERLKSRYHGPAKLMAGEDGLLAAATYDRADTVLTSLVGFAGLKPTLAAIAAGKNIALANKETLVAAGDIVTKAAKDKGVNIVPVDSEHSAILQSLNGERHANISKIILTASGGPFFGWTKDQLQHVTVAACLRHPNWSMGKKITVDSATLVNKGLEVIEAKWLFDVDYDQIEVVIHPQSIVHSMVEFTDGAVIAQLGRPDMRQPIQYALTYPERVPSVYPRMNFAAVNALIFAPPDTETFPALDLAFAAGRTGGTLPCVLNAANEIAVNAFLDLKITFLDIIDIIRHTMNHHQVVLTPTLADLCAADEWARASASQAISQSK